MTKKVKKRILKIFSIIGICIVSLFAIAWGIGFFDSNEIPTYDFSGYVYADGEALAGATVSCGVAKTETDENGYYEFKKLTSVVEVTVTKDNHIFAKNLVYVNGNKTDVNFSGYEKYSVTGIVKNGEQVVADAKIQVTSQMGTYTTYSNAFGEFSLPEVAGEVQLTATHNDYTLFSQSFDKTKKDNQIVVACLTSITGQISVDDTNTQNYDFVLKLNDQEIELNSDLSFNITQVKAGDVLSLQSQNYYIQNNQVSIFVENGEFEFNAQKYYNLTGYVKSGETPLVSTRVEAGTKKAYTDSQGYFEILNLYGNNTVVASLNNFSFIPAECNKDNSQLNFDGKFTLKGKVITDNNQPNGIIVECNNQTDITNNKGEFTFDNVQLGKTVTIADQTFYVNQNSITLTNTKPITFELKKLYSLSLAVEHDLVGLSGATVTLNGQNYVTDKNGLLVVDGLYGTNNFTISADGYKFETIYSSDYLNSSLTITPYKYFNVSGIVRSGKELIQNANIAIAGTNLQTNENGEFLLDNLYLSGTAKVTAQGFNSQQIDYSNSSNILDINLSYDLNGKVVCGTQGIDSVKVSYLENQTETDAKGNFKIKELYGKVELNFEKQYYTITKAQVLGNSNFVANATYEISGRVFDALGNIVGMDVLLVKNNAQTDTQTCKTDANGEFMFTGLVGEYLLIYDTTTEKALLPNGYTITTGGVYNFADVGYRISGRVMSGDIPVAGVLVTAGDLTATTNDRGYYKFDLIIQDETLVLYKEGYTFENNNLPIDMSFDGRQDINFNCTYSLVGKVVSGTTPLQNATVTAGLVTTTTNADGEYELLGLTGKVNLSATIDGYYIQDITEITEHNTYNLIAKFDSTLTVKTGDIFVAQVEVFANGEQLETNEQGLVELIGMQLGDVVSFYKLGYEIADYTFNSNTTADQVDCTYKVKGKVFVTTRALDGVTVKCGEVIVVTNANGEFEFSGLIGQQNITLEKETYNFETIIINKYQELTVKAMFTVSGYVIVTGAALEGVKVTVGEDIAYTNEDGYFEIKNVSTEQSIILEKIGYEFDQEFTANGPTSIQASAKYGFSGYVKSGNINIQGATITLSNGTTYTTDANGFYSVEGLSQAVNATVTKNGYDTAVIENIERYSNSVNFDLTYSVVINLNGISGLTGITIAVAGSSQTYDNTQVTFTKLTGDKLITISKEGYNFSPSQVLTTQTQTINVTVVKEYVVSGRITTTSGKPVANAVVQINDKTAITNTNGNYSIGGLVGTVRPKLVLEVKDTAYKGENYSYSVNLGQCTTDTTLNYTSLNEFNYAFYLFKKGYQNLNDANSYQIFGGGTVKDSASGEDQYVNIVYKKDSNNKRIIQDLNWHDGKIMGIVDPRVSQLTYVDLNTKTVKFQTVKETNVGKDASSTNYTTNWSTTSYQDYLDNFGVNPEGYYPYVLTTSTINQSEELNFAYDATNQVYTFEFNLNCDEAMYKYYVIKMSNMCSSQTFQSFESSKLTYTIGADGFIRQLDIYEVYNVKASIVNSKVTDKFTYVFKTKSLNEQIPAIDVSSLEKIRTSLSEQTATTIAMSKIVVTNSFFNKRRMY